MCDLSALGGFKLSAGGDRLAPGLLRTFPVSGGFFHILSRRPPNFIYTKRSFPRARERLRIRKVLEYFTENHGRRHFNDGISIYFVCTVYLTILSSHLRICFQKFQICRFEFRGFSPPGRHRVSRVSEKNKDLGVRLCLVESVYTL